MSTHKAIATTGLGKVEEIQLPTPTPGPGEVLIKIAYGGLSPADAYVADLGLFIREYPVVLGFNISGNVQQLGEGVDDLKVGDRVIVGAFAPRTSTAAQQYCVQSRSVIGKIPDSLPLDAATTIPDNVITAFYAVFNQLGLPIPSSFPPTSPPANADVPILVYGAGATSGQYALQLLRAAGYTKILATASPRNHEAAKDFGAHAVFDYKSPTLAEDVAKFVGGNGKVKLVLDSISAEGTMKLVSGLVDEDGVVGMLMPIKKGNGLSINKMEDILLGIPTESSNPFASGVKLVAIRTLLYQQDPYLRDNLMPTIIPKLLEDNIIRPTRVRLLDQGSLLERVTTGLNLLRNGQVSGEKVVVKIDH
ncbi:GroES-like protein [Pluteus cervinus]|uniref:GroES-like protein n=1 Tax=Pluteus cervinus TaxID=181527 RepID=A0ACD3ARS1_9AGAR|nr:GroES-like protein [Pluteus cervinus]